MTPSLGKAAGLVEENSLLTALLSGQNGGGGRFALFMFAWTKRNSKEAVSAKCKFVLGYTVKKWHS